MGTEDILTALMNTKIILDTSFIHPIIHKFKISRFNKEDKLISINAYLVDKFSQLVPKSMIKNGKWEEYAKRIMMDALMDNIFKKYNIMDSLGWKIEFNFYRKKTSTNQYERLKQIKFNYEYS